MTEAEIGLLLTLTLIGDTIISLWITTAADRVGRRRMLVTGAGLVVLAGLLFSLTNNYTLLLLAATIGVISPTGNEVGPFLSVEQAALAQIVPNAARTRVFAWYNLVGSFATAIGALVGGTLAQVLQGAGLLPVDSYRVVVISYALVGISLVLLFRWLSENTEAPLVATPSAPTLIGMSGDTRPIIFKLAALFSIDAFAGGFVLQSVIAYWFYLRFPGVQPGLLGSIFFGANILAGLSSLSAARIAARFGLVNTMVFTHIPSNILLILVPLMPNLPSAVLMLFARFSISQMDVPTRQSYTMAVVPPHERAAAAGVTNVARSTGASLAPLLATPMVANAMLSSLPFFIAGGLKVVYDLLLFASFRRIRPPEEVELRTRQQGDA